VRGTVERDAVSFEVGGGGESGESKWSCRQSSLPSREHVSRNQIPGVSGDVAMVHDEGKLIRMEVARVDFAGVTGGFFVPPSVVESCHLGFRRLNEDGEMVSSSLGVIRWLLVVR